MMWSAIAVAIVGSTGLWTLINYLIQRRFSKKDAMLVLLHDKVYYISQKAILRGSIGFNELDNLVELYSVYEKLGGNGTGKVLYEKAINLPKTEDTPFN